MKVGDKAFFYHSNCKQPGIAGIVEVFTILSITDYYFISYRLSRKDMWIILNLIGRILIMMG